MVTPDGELAERVTEMACVARGDTEPSVRKAAITALSVMGLVGHAAQPQIVEALVNDLDPGVRSVAVDALSEMGDAALAGIQEITRALDDSNRCVRLSAVKALGKIGPLAPASVATEIATSLARTLTNDHSLGIPLLCIASLVALGEYGHGHGPASALASLLQSSPSLPSIEVRTAAVDALGKMGDAGVSQASALAAVLRTDPFDGVRYAAALALGEFGELAAEHASEVDAALLDTDEDVREAAARALGAMGAASAPYASDLAKRLLDDHEDVRAAAAMALKALGEVAAPYVSEVVEVLSKDTSAAARAAAASALGSIGTSAQAHITDLEAALGDEDDDVRIAAVISLGDLGEGKTEIASTIAAALSQAFADSSEVVRSFSLDALGRLGVAGQVYALRITEMIRDEDSEVRAAAVRLLLEVGVADDERSAVLSKLVFLRENEDEGIRTCATEALDAMTAEGTASV